MSETQGYQQTCDKCGRVFIGRIPPHKCAGGFRKRHIASVEERKKLDLWYTLVNHYAAAIDRMEELMLTTATSSMAQMRDTRFLANAKAVLAKAKEMK